MRNGTVLLLLMALSPFLVSFGEAFDEAVYNTREFEDNDEFEGVYLAIDESTKVAWTNREKKQEVKPKSTYEMIRDQWIPFIPDGLEYYILALVIVYVVHFLYGKDSNDKKATKWKNLLDPVFVRLQETRGATSTHTSRMFKDSLSSYKIHANGWGKFAGILVKLVCFPRWDLFLSSLSLFGISFESSTDDLMTLEIPVLDGKMEPFVFIVCKKKTARVLRENSKAVRNLCSLTAYKHLPKEFCVVTDCPELTPKLLDKIVISFITKSEGSFRMLQITDHNHYEKNTTLRLNKIVIRLTMKVQTHAQMSWTPKLITTGVHLAEVATSLSFPDKMRTRAYNARSRARWRN